MSNWTPEVTQFIEAVCGQGNGVLSISYTTDSHLKSLRSDFIDASDINAVEKHLASLPKGAQVVFNFARLANAPTKGRGKITDTHAFSVIGMDIDIADPNKPNKALPLDV